MGKILRYFLWTFSIFSIFIMILYFFCSGQIGRLEAEYDLWRGRYEIHGFGLFMGAPSEIEDLKPYGIEYRHVAGCVVNDLIIKRVDEYNSTMIKAIKQNLNIEVDWPVDTFEVERRAIEAMDEATAEFEKRSASGQQFIYTLNPENIEGSLDDIGDCFYNDQVELDGDSTEEEVCLRYAKSERNYNSHSYTSLVVDLSKVKKNVLRQGIDRTFYFEECFVSFKDIDVDGRAELITRVRFSPDCSSCNAYRIYELVDYIFELKINLFGIDLDLSSLKNILTDLTGYDKKILSFLKDKTKSEYPCGVHENCTIFDPWLVDTDRDGLFEMVMLVEPPKDDFDFRNQPSHLFWAKYSAAGEILQCNFIPLPLEYNGHQNVLGFLETCDNSIHLLINIADTGTSSGFPILNVFDLHYPEIRKIGQFSGFYEHAIVDRLRDLDGDGNTEIIFVGESSVPTNAANADIPISYDIAEYRDGKYIENNAKFKNIHEQINH